MMLNSTPVRLLTLLVFLLCAPSVAAQDQPRDNFMAAGYVTLAAASLMDIELTGRARELGLREANPVYRWVEDVPGGIGLVNGAISGAIGVAVYRLHKSGKRKTARWILWTMNGAKVAVVAWNYRQIQKRR